jgi:cytochrome P450
MGHYACTVDPFDEFDRAMGQGRVRDPYPEWAELRRRGPVHGVPGGNVFLALSYDAVQQVLLDGATFGSGFYADVIGPVMGRTILQMDEPEHSRHRGLLQAAFSRTALARWEKDVVRPVVNAYVDRFAARGHADLVRELTFPFPVQVIAHMIGVPASDHAAFHRAAVELISVSFDFQRGIRAGRKLAELFRPLLAARRAVPTGDLSSVLAQTDLDDEEIFSFLRLLAPAGAETTYRSSSNLLFGLLTHPDQLDAVRRERMLVVRAIEEGLRWEPPLTGIMRVARRDAELCGVKIPAGSVVGVSLGSANRDETRWEHPERFDVFREPRAHMAFGYGSHRCLGMHLARLETTVLLETLFDRLPALRLDPTVDDVHITGQGFRSPRSLPVVWDA